MTVRREIKIFGLLVATAILRGIEWTMTGLDAAFSTAADHTQTRANVHQRERARDFDENERTLLAERRKRNPNPQAN